MRRRARTVALPLALTFLALLGLTAALTHPHEAVTFSISSISSRRNPPGSPSPWTFSVSGTVDSHGAVYKKCTGVNAILMRNGEPFTLSGSGSFGGSRRGPLTFTHELNPKGPVDGEDLSIRLDPQDVAGRLHDPIFVPVKAE